MEKDSFIKFTTKALTLAEVTELSINTKNPVEEGCLISVIKVVAQEFMENTGFIKSLINEHITAEEDT